MKKILKNILSIEVMIVFLILIALCSAVATFIENDFGPLGSRSFIYNQHWFEILFVICSIGILYHIIFSQIHKKLFSLLIHISLVFIAVGAIVTRYYGFEATMTIPETTMNNIAYSSDEYISLKIDEDEIYSKKVMVSPLFHSSFDVKENVDDKPFEISLQRYIQNATISLIESDKGVPTVDIFLASLDGSKNILLKQSEFKDSQYVSFSFDKKLKTNKPTIFFELDSNSFYLSSNIDISVVSIDKNGILKTIKKDEKFKVDTSLIYKVGQVQFKIKNTALKGKLSTVEIPTQKDANLNALVFNIKYEDKSLEKTIFKSEGNQFPQKLEFDLGDKKIELSWGAKVIELPFYIHLNDFELKRYPGSDAPSEYSSDVKVFDKKDNYTSSHVISMNNVLDYKGYRFFQSSYKKDESATILSINKDPGKELTYVGYFLLFSGLILSLFSKNGRFRKLSTTKYDIENIKVIYEKNKNMVSAFIISLLFLFSTNTYANEVFNIDKNFSDKLSKTLVQDYQGRIKPLDTLSKQILTKLDKKVYIKELDSNQFFISASLYPEYWKAQEIFKIKSPKLKEVLGIALEKKYIKFNDIFDRFGNYKLETSLNESNSKKPANRGEFDKELIKLDEKLNIMYTLFTGDFLRVFPLKNNEKDKWITLNEANLFYHNIEIVDLSKEFYLSMLEATKTSNWEKVNENLKKIDKFQKDNTGVTLPSSFKIQSEVLFNKLEIFKRLIFLYLIVGLVLLVFTILNIINIKVKLQKMTKISLVLLFIAFVIHTAGLILRWYISGHAPWSNAYESMLFIAWTIILSGMFFSKQSHLALASTAILSGITLFVAHLNWLEPQITTLAPVLKSYWLSIHVSVITASYGFLALSAILGFISLLLFIFLNEKNKNDRFYGLLVGIKESNRISMMSIFIGLVLLVIGNFLGAIWANESWGRYWGWDPKETWTLISIIVYTIIIHLNYVKNFMSEYIFAVLSTFSYATIIMTYFGVNYFLSGKHSYAAGDPIPIPTFVPITFCVLVLVCILSYKNRKVI